MRRTALLTVAGFTALALLLAGALALGAGWVIDLRHDLAAQRIDDEKLDRQLAAQGVPETAEPTDSSPAALNILMLGSDSRDATVDYASGRGFRTDTIMVVHIPADRRGVQIVSVPRDSWVAITGHGRAKINAASAYGGLPLATSTVAALLGTQIDHVVIVDFVGFAQLTDDLGGVDVRSPRAFEADGHRFKKGVNRVGGDAALAFVRARKQFADGDLQRVRNQQEFLRAVAHRLRADGTATDPVKLARLVTTLGRAVTVDRGFATADIVRLGVQLSGVPAEGIGFATVPIAGDARSSGELYLRVDKKGLRKLRAAFASDGLADYVASAADQHY